jgi:hypothetical protein
MKKESHKKPLKLFKEYKKTEDNCQKLKKFIEEDKKQKSGAKYN